MSISKAERHRIVTKLLANAAQWQSGCTPAEAMKRAKEVMEKVPEAANVSLDLPRKLEAVASQCGYLIGQTLARPGDLPHTRIFIAIPTLKDHDTPKRLMEAIEHFTGFAFRVKTTTGFNRVFTACFGRGKKAIHINILDPYAR